MDEVIIEFPEIAEKSLMDFAGNYENAIDGVILSKNLAFVKMAKFLTEPTITGNKNIEYPEISWSFRQPVAQFRYNYILSIMPDTFLEFRDNTIEEILNNKTACEIIKNSIDLISLQEVMSLPEILNSVFLRKVGIVVNKDIPIDTSVHLDIMDMDSIQ